MVVIPKAEGRGIERITATNENASSTRYVSRRSKEDTSLADGKVEVNTVVTVGTGERSTES